LARIETQMNGLTIIVGATLAVKFLPEVRAIEDIKAAIDEADRTVNELKESRGKRRPELISASMP